MHHNANKVFYTLAIFILAMTFFVLKPSASPEVSTLQNSIQQQFSVAWQQTMGDQPYFSEVAEVYDGVSAFYDQATVAYFDLVSQPQTDQDIIYVYSKVYTDLAVVFKHSAPTQPAVAEAPVISTKNFMTQAAIYNIVPDDPGSVIRDPGSVLGQTVEPVNGPNGWVNIQDNFTGQIYCLSVYNAEVNKYLGACKDNSNQN